MCRDLYNNMQSTVFSCELFYSNGHTSNSSLGVEKLEPFIRDESQTDFARILLSHWPGEVDQVSLRTLLDLSSSSCRVGGGGGLGQSSGLCSQGGANYILIRNKLEFSNGAYMY